jgi:hypothetical protein
MLVPAARSAVSLLLLLITGAVARAVSPDPRLLQLVPPQSPIVAGIHSPSTQGLPGNFLLVAKANRVDMDDFLSLTGADTSRILREVIFVSGGVRDPVKEHSLLASGVFGRASIFRYADGTRATIEDYRGINVMVVPPLQRERKYFTDLRWLAILESNIAIFGTISSVQCELDRYLDHSQTETMLVERLKYLSKKDATWSVVGTPLPGPHLERIFGRLDRGMGASLSGGGIFEVGFEFGLNQVTVHYQLEPVLSTGEENPQIDSAQGRPSDSAGTEADFLPHPGDRRRGKIIRGSLKVPVNRYDGWLTKMIAGGQSTNTPTLK